MLSWPPQCPDLPPIELDGKSCRQVRNECPAKETELFVGLKRCWEGLDTSCFQNLLKSMLQICTAVIKTVCTVT